MGRRFESSSERVAECSFEARTLVDLLRHRAEQQPDTRAYTFLDHEGKEEVSLSYDALDRRARAIATWLASVHEAGERALLVYPPGLEFIAGLFGCLYANVIAVPVYAPRANRGLDRLLAIIGDARPVVALTTNSVLTRIRPLIEQIPQLKALEWKVAESAGDELAEAWRSPAIESRELALLQYTSGSTAHPKGVMLSHGNVLHNQRMIQEAFQQSEESVVAGWLPLFHDMGLIGNVLQPLFVGAHCVLMSPVAFLQRPLSWLEMISRWRATTSGGPNFAYDLCVRTISPEKREALDLRSWTVAFNGSEPVRGETLERFAEAFKVSGFRREAFYPCYGLAEATLFVSGKTMNGPRIRAVHRGALEQGHIAPAMSGHPEARNLVSCGRARSNGRVAVVDPVSLAQCPPGQVGEIWVSGPSVAQGYWDQPDESRLTFQAFLTAGQGPFLRTGDLGAISDGELYVTGRLKDLVIIRGRNHYPQDIEASVERSHPRLRPGCGAAFSIDVKGEERLVVVQELDRAYQNPDTDQLTRAIRQRIAQEHELQAYAVVLIKAGTISKTSSGKIQRRACRSQFLEGKLKTVATSVIDVNDVASTDLVEVTREELLAIESEAERRSLLEAFLKQQLTFVAGTAALTLEPDQPLISLGLDSLQAIELRHELQSQLGVSIPATAFLDGSGVARLTSCLLSELAVSAAESTISPTTSGNLDSEYPLSYGQRALWFLHQLAPEAAAYNLPAAVRIRSQLDIELLKETLQQLLDRHVCLRTIFAVCKGEPVQRVQTGQLDYFEHLDASSWSENQLTDELARRAHLPFNLEQGPLLRVNLFSRTPVDHVLLLNLHHLITDFWSFEILLRELGEIYSAKSRGDPMVLASLKTEYREYVRWQAELIGTDQGERLWSYWRNRLAGGLPVISLPTDRPRPPVQTYAGASSRFRLGASVTASLRSLAASQGATLYAVLLAAYLLLLHRYSGQDDVLVGSVAAGRSLAGFANIVGYFINPVVLRATLSANLTVREMIGEVRRILLEALEHSDFPLALLAERLQPGRSPGHTPLFQVMFIWQKARRGGDPDAAALALGESGLVVRTGELELEPVSVPQQTTQFELSLMMAEAGGEILAELQYSTDLFDACTISRAAAHFSTLVAGLAADPAKAIWSLPLLTEGERAQAIVEWNDEETGYEQGRLIHQLIASQAERTPDSVAIVFEDQMVSFRAVNERANRIAHCLISLGVGREDLIAVCLHRSPHMLIGLLGVLKAGSAYLPLDPSYPAGRLAFILDDAAVSIVVTEEELVSRLPACGIRAIRLDSDWEQIARQSCENPVGWSTPDQLAYVIYTSGSTGRPKGVMVGHRNVSNFFAGIDRRVGCERRDRLLAVTSISFDISVLELFWTLARGARVIVVGGQGETRALEGASRRPEKGIGFSLFYFATAEADSAREAYRLVFEGARFADEHGFEAVWTPERHFHAFGGLYPNPSVMSAALAAITRRVQIRAGSVVLPLHHPIRVAEEWALVDNISNGRVGISLASGWHADDFVFSPERYADRKAAMFCDAELVKKLWRGEAVSVRGGAGNEIEVKILPRPVQAELPIWVTAAGNEETFIKAGEIGANLLTHLLGQSLEQLAQKIGVYRTALIKNGHDPASRRVTLMLHTFVAENMEVVRQKVREPFINYLRSSVGLISNLVRSLNLPLDLERMSAKDMEDLLAFAYERYFDTSALFGTPETCLPMVERLKEMGIDEIACLVDFGIDVDSVLASLPRLNELKDLANRRERVADYSLSSQAARCQPTLMQCTPSLIRMLDYTIEAHDFFRSIRALLLGGEALPPSIANRVRGVLRGRLFNMYGPTETTVWSATKDLTEPNEVVSIGRPIANTQMYVLSPHLQPVAVRVSGEVFLGGHGVARGYLNRPQLTAEKFIPDPFSNEPGARLYATGDVGRRGIDGCVEFLGRIDYQVKVRGFRVEISEVEGWLCQHPGVREAAVTAREDSTGSMRLIAYVAGEGPIDTKGMQSFLIERLPDYMVPAAFIALDALPLTANGKVDREALPGTQQYPGELTVKYAAPRSRLERAIARVWQKALNVENVGLNDNFFDLGGHSLLMAQVHSQLRTELERDVPLIKLLEHPTISSLARYLAQNVSDVSALRQSRDRAQQQRAALSRQRQATIRARQ